MKELHPKDRKKVKERAAYLIAEERTLRDLRKAMQLTQDRMAKLLDVDQGSISKIEQRTDLLISTLRTYIEGMGGQLHLIAEFPHRPAVELAGFAAMENDRRKKAAEKHPD
ncbi:MAG TPA: XRE family transcriptional regulator [Candidatus Eisenbacteria bacterium]|nr:XRE family transcriptional regulator [Candidatus Eisenbacteria bacterium]